jgi:hypothetical protein
MENRATLSRLVAQSAKVREAADSRVSAPGCARAEICGDSAHRRTRSIPRVMALALAAAAPACVYAPPAPDEPAPVVEYVASEPCPVVEPAPEPVPVPVPHPLDGTPPPVVEPAGVYCTPSIVWEFGPGRAVGLYHSTTGQLQRGWVAQLDDEITLVWQRPCAVAETGTPALCELAETWPVVVTADAITVGGVTAVGEWAGGCDQ